MSDFSLMRGQEREGWTEESPLLLEEDSEGTVALLVPEIDDQELERGWLPDDDEPRVDWLEWLRWRRTSGFGWVEGVVLALYTVLLAVTLHFHELWGDEAQAWLIARDNSYWEIFRHRLHYEGAPLVWPFFLHTLHRMHVPYLAMGYASAIFPIAGIYLWLRCSPFPAPIRLLVPFTFFLQYQYAVVARSYVMFPLLVFGLCVLYTSRRMRVISFAVVAALLANLCMQGATVAGAFVLLYAWDYRDELRQAFRRGEHVGRRVWLTAAGVLLVALGTTIYAAMPAPDVGFAVTEQVSSGLAHDILEVLVGDAPHDKPRIDKAMKFNGNPNLVSPWFADGVVMGDKLKPIVREIAPRPRFKDSPRYWLAWQLMVIEEKKAFSGTLSDAIYFVLEMASPLLYSLSTSNLLGIVLLVITFFWAWGRRSLDAFAPFMALWIVGEFLWIADHHVGMLPITLLAGAWIAGRRGGFGRLWIERGLVVALLAVVSLQVVWAATSVRNDVHASYDPGKETADWLKANEPKGARMAAFNWSEVSMQPYFDSNPFINVTSSWWQWNRWNTTNAYHHLTLSTEPDVVIYSDEFRLSDEMRNQVVPLNLVPEYDRRDPVLEDIYAHGYRQTHVFCGERFARMSTNIAVCNMVFEPGVLYPLPK